MLAAGVTVLSWWAARSAPRSPTMTAYAAVALLLGAHMLPHTMQAIALRRMLPGLAGGLAISCPTRCWWCGGCSIGVWLTRTPLLAAGRAAIRLRAAANHPY